MALAAWWAVGCTQAVAGSEAPFGQAQSAFHVAGIGYHTHWKDMPGKSHERCRCQNLLSGMPACLRLVQVEQEICEYLSQFVVPIHPNFSHA